MKLWKASLATLASVCVVLSATLSISHAETPQKPVDQAVNVFESTVLYPIPVWQTSSDDREQTEHFSKQTGQSFIAEQIPKGESLKNWTMLYAVSGMYLPENPKLKLGRFISMSLTPLMRKCGEENLSIVKLSENALEARLVVFCTQTPNGDVDAGYGAGTGEIAVMAFYRVHNTFVKVYHQWRGKSFATDDNSTWPMKTNDLDDMVERFKNITISLSANSKSKPKK